MIMKMIIKNDYIQLRKIKGITQLMVANFLGLNASSICQYENNKSKLSLYNEHRYRMFIDNENDEYTEFIEANRVIPVYKPRIKIEKIKSPEEIEEIRLNLINKNETLELIQNQVVNRQQALEITKQTSTAFSQTVKLGFLTPLITYGEGKGSYSFFYRQEVEEYARVRKDSKVAQRL